MARLSSALAVTLAASLFTTEAFAQSQQIAGDAPVTPVPSPDVADDDDWYGHWQLLAGTIGVGLYSLGVWGVRDGDGSDAVAAGIGSGYLLFGFTMSSVVIHLDHENEVAAVVGGVSRFTLGVAAPSIASAACAEERHCDATVAISTAATLMVPVIVDALIAWED